MKKMLLLGACAALLCSACAPARKDLKASLAATDAGTLWFSTAGSLNPVADGSRLAPGDSVAISGELRFPAGAGPFPAVILAHGCAGVGPVVYDWARVLRDWGYATLILDSFAGRGLVEVCSNGKLNSTQRIPDAYGALRILATHPKIDAGRVFLMGFSHGGGLAVGASTAWAKETFAPSGRPAFRAFLPFYANCNLLYPEAERISAPVRFHHGALDDWLPAESCVRLAEGLRASGQDAAITVYPGAYHAFDNPGLRRRYLPDVNNPSKCEVRASSILVRPTGLAGCLRKGATIEGNAEATERARENVRAQLAEWTK